MSVQFLLIELRPNGENGVTEGSAHLTRQSSWARTASKLRQTCCAKSAGPRRTLAKTKRCLAASAMNSKLAAATLSELDELSDRCAFKARDTTGSAPLRQFGQIPVRQKSCLDH